MRHYDTSYGVNCELKERELKKMIKNEIENESSYTIQDIKKLMNIIIDKKMVNFYEIVDFCVDSDLDCFLDILIDNFYFFKLYFSDLVWR